MSISFLAQIFAYRYKNLCWKEEVHLARRIKLPSEHLWATGRSCFHGKCYVAMFCELLQAVYTFYTMDKLATFDLSWSFQTLPARQHHHGMHVRTTPEGSHAKHCSSISKVQIMMRHGNTAALPVLAQSCCRMSDVSTSRKGPVPLGLHDQQEALPCNGCAMRHVSMIHPLKYQWTCHQLTDHFCTAFLPRKNAPTILDTWYKWSNW